jgi:uncharacterized protein (TIGR03437 family)
MGGKMACLRTGVYKQARKTLLAAMFVSTTLSPGIDALNCLTFATHQPKNQKSRLSKLATYNNEKWGISFQYPSNYILTELNEPAINNGLQSWQMFDGHPGEIQLVQLVFPDNLFPGTDLSGASLALDVNRNLSREECFAATSPDSDHPEHRSTFDGIEFRWTEAGDAPSATLFRDYGGFANGTCYEIQTAIMTTRFGPPPGITRVNQDAVQALFYKILQSIKFHPAGINAGVQNIPSILSFRTERPEGESFPLNARRFSWEVTGADADQVTLDFPCSALPFTSSVLAPDATEQSSISCGSMNPLGSLSGSIILELPNHTGLIYSIAVRLLVQGREAASKTIDVELPSTALLLLPTFNGQVLDSSAFRRFSPGLHAGLFGSAFIDEETVWIGSVSFPAHTLDPRHIEFTIPASIPAGEFPLHVSDARGKSNVLTVIIERLRPRIAYVNNPPGRPDSADPIFPGQVVRIVGNGFTSNNFVTIGATKVAGGAADFVGFQLYFTVPTSLAPGTYPLFVTSDLGETNRVTITVIGAPPTH